MMQKRFSRKQSKAKGYNTVWKEFSPRAARAITVDLK